MKNIPVTALTILALALIVLTLWATRASRSEPTFPSLPGGAIVVENSGQICFRPCDECRTLQATFRPAGCFSSSCTRDVQQFGDVRVDQESFKIQFRTRFVAIDPLGPGVHACTADCYKPSTEFWIGHVRVGTYSIWLGEKEVGELPVPPVSLTGKPICFTDNPPEPTPTFDEPTATPWSSPLGFPSPLPTPSP
jgi:hypothetical protein